jgi:hypothetical protein
MKTDQCQTLVYSQQYTGVIRQLVVQCVGTHKRAQIPPHNDTRYKTAMIHQQGYYLTNISTTTTPDQ